MVSPPMPSGSRLVATRCTLGHRRKMASAVLAQPPIRCSQLSSTISMSCGARASSRVSRTGRPGWAAIPSASQMADATASSSETAASSTSQTPSPDPSSSSAATCRPSLVLPHPPAPVSVTRRDDSTRARTSASSRSRPMNVASWAGRLFRSAGLPSERSGGNPACRPAAWSWKIRSGRPRSFSRCTPRSASDTPGGSAVAHQRGRRLRQQDLPPVSDRRHPGGPMHIQAHQARGRLRRLTGMHAHPHPDVLPGRPRVCLQGPLHLHHRRHARPR